MGGLTGVTAQLSLQVAAASVWLTFVTCAKRHDVRQAWASIFWGFASTLAFVALLQSDSSLRGWADIYYFCSSAEEPLVYCTCDLSWSRLGYLKFLVCHTALLAAIAAPLTISACLERLFL